MILKAGTVIEMKNGKNGVNIRKDTNVGAWGQAIEMTLEAPVRFQGGNIQCFHIGAFTYINDNAYIRAVKKIGRFCAIGPNLVVGMPEHSARSISPHIIFPNYDSDWANDFTDYANDNEKMINVIRKKQSKELKPKGMIEIGNDVWIGGNVTLMRGIKVGDGAILAAGSVVVKDVPPYSIVGGVPAKVIRYRFNDNIIKTMLHLKWWEYGPDILKGCDVTNIGATIKTLEKRIKSGFPKYNPEIITLDFQKQSIISNT